MMKAEFGFFGASNLIASPFCRSLIDLVRVTLILPLVWPLGGAGHRKTRTGAPATTAIEVKRLLIHQAMKVRLVNRGAVDAAIRLEFYWYWLAGRGWEANGPARLAERRPRHGPCLLAALVQDPRHILRAELGAPGPERRKGLDHPLRQQLLLVVAADLGFAAEL